MRPARVRRRRSDANTQAAVPDLPAVSHRHPPKPLAPPVACSTVDLNDADHVGFVFDSTTFRDPAGARVTLRKLANVILKNDESVTLTGSTSSEGSDPTTGCSRCAGPRQSRTAWSNSVFQAAGSRRSGTARTCLAGSMTAAPTASCLSVPADPEPQGGGQAHRPKCRTHMKPIRYGQWTALGRRLTRAGRTDGPGFPARPSVARSGDDRPSRGADPAGPGRLCLRVPAYSQNDRRAAPEDHRRPARLDAGGLGAESGPSRRWTWSRAR